MVQTKYKEFFFDVPFEIAKERNASRERVVPEHALDRMHKSLADAPPELLDGFDSIFSLDSESHLVEMRIKQESKEIRKEFMQSK